MHKYLGDKDKCEEFINKTETAFKVNESLILAGKVPTKKLASPSFFMGSAGLYTMGALLFKEMGQKEKMMLCYKEVMNSFTKCKGTYAEDDLLYGNAGYLYCLLLLYIEDNVLFNCKKDIIEVVNLLKNEGISGGPKGMLKYTWPRKSEKFYYGAAHGLMGILCMLVQAADRIPEIYKDTELIKLIEKSCDYMLAQQFPSGNFPSSMGSENDKLVHFCHGATGAVPFLLAAHKLLKKEAYFNAALKAGNLIWERGLLKKGNGICHGITGNAYAFHSLFRYTGDEKWKYRCYMFVDASWNEEIQKHVLKYKDPTRITKGMPDTPFSLMEGAGGTAVLYADLQGKNENVKFPGYEL